MLFTSLSALVLSIFPFAIHHIGAQPTVTWAVSSTLLAAYYVVTLFVDTRRLRRVNLQNDPQFQMWILVVTYVIAAVAVVTQILNVFGIGFHRTFGAFFLGVCCLLLTCTLMFVRLLSFVGQQFAEE